MSKPLKIVIGVVVAAVLVVLLIVGGLVASAAAEGLKDAKDVKIAVVVHGSASDAYWSVVKRGVDDAAFSPFATTNNFALSRARFHETGGFNENFRLAAAEDRLWQMEILRRIAAGRLAEVFGASQEETDAFIRTLGWRQSAEADWTVASPDLKAALQAYADGVNAFIASKGGTGLGFTVAGALAGKGLGYTPEPWTPIDSLGYAKLQAWNLGGNMASEIWRILAKFGVANRDWQAAVCLNRALCSNLFP